MVRFDFSQLSDDEFEELCTELMRKEGFQNVRRLSGPGPGDQGRDIHAEENLSTITHATIPTRILVQCKNYGGSRTTISSTDVEALANRARTHNYTRILIITSHDLSSPAKITANGMISNPNWRILAEWWNVHDLTRLVLKYPAILRQFALGTVPPSSLNIAILDGFARDRVHEKPCVPTFSAVPTKDWAPLLQDANSTISFISASEIDTYYDAILNPFGETYPEENHESKTTYLRILNYISMGGLFVNVAGFPFFYYWNHERAESVPIARRRLIINPETRQIASFIHFSDTPAYRDFRLSLDSRSPTEVTISQTAEDKRYVGNLLGLGIERVTQFRAVIPGNPQIIPLLRAEEGRIYPLAALKHGNGHLMISGLDLHPTEAPLVSTALKNWLLTGGGQFPLTNDA